MGPSPCSNNDRKLAPQIVARVARYSSNSRGLCKVLQILHPPSGIAKTSADIRSHVIASSSHLCMAYVQILLHEYLLFNSEASLAARRIMRSFLVPIGNQHEAMPVLLAASISLLISSKPLRKAHCLSSCNDATGLIGSIHMHFSNSSAATACRRVYRSSICQLLTVLLLYRHLAFDSCITSLSTHRFFEVANLTYAS